MSTEIHREIITPLEIVVAVDSQGGFGKDGKIPWNHPEDLAHFKELTTGHICIMGRKTYDDTYAMRKARNPKANMDEILPNRQTFVITSQNHFPAPGATRVKSIREAVTGLSIKDTRKIFIIGGEKVFLEALPWTTKIHMTMIPGHFDCDRFFPIKALNNYSIATGAQEGDLKFITYVRK